MFSIKLIGKLFKFILILAVLAVLFRLGGEIPKKLYPMPYKDTVSQYAQEYDVDEFLVYSVMKAESGFQEDAQSHKDAFGLMQMTLETAQWAGAKVGVSIQDQQDILDPETNIQLGTWFLSYLLKQYDGDLTKALCAYNAGSGNVAKWLEEVEHSSDGVTLQNIPFEETKKYVEKVYRYYERYQQLYGEA